MATRKKAGVIKQASIKERPQYGYCPKCSSSWVVKNGDTTNVGSEKQRYICKSCGHRTTTPLKEPPKPATPMRRTLPKAKRYIITAAQNATPIHKPTWAALLQCAKYYDAEIVVIPGRYKNPTSIWTQNNEDNEWWDEAVVPYLCRGRIQLNERLMIVGDVKVQWASSNPLGGMDALTKDMSGIVGHGSRALRSVPTPQYTHPKIMFTTGACTRSNYTDTKAGKIAAAKHTFGGLIVEIDGKAFYARQLDAMNDGSFIDLDMEFTPDEARPAKRALALAIGDLHYRWANPKVINATLTGPDNLVSMVNPKVLFWHDVLDFHSRNHHHLDDWLTGYGKWKYGIESVRTEMDEVIDFIHAQTPKGRESMVVSSNHDQAATKWLKRADYKTDFVNTDFIIECAKRAKDSVRKGSGGIEYDDVFTSYAKTRQKPNVHFMTEGESNAISRVEYGFHGDKGPNGSKGTTKNLSKMGVKVTKGHSHIAEIVNACYSVGKCTGMLEYEKSAPSAHTNSHALQYANGKRTIITIINGRFCLPRPKK